MEITFADLHHHHAILNLLAMVHGTRAEDVHDEQMFGYVDLLLGPGSGLQLSYTSDSYLQKTCA
jgi:allantoicase